MPTHPLPNLPAARASKPNKKANQTQSWDDELEEIKKLTGVSSSAPKANIGTASTSRPAAPSASALQNNTPMPKRKQAYKPINQYDYAIDEGKESYFAKHRAGLIAVICILAVVLLIGIAGIVIRIVSSSPRTSDNVILNNVTLAGVHIGGMTQEQAEDAVFQALGRKFETEDMVVSINDAIVILSPAKTRARLDIPNAVLKTVRYGREGSAADQALAKTNSYSSNHAVDLIPYLNLDQEYIRNVLEVQTQHFSDLYTPSSYEVEGTMPPLDPEHFNISTPCQTLILKTGTSGFGIDTNSLLTQILDAYSAGVFHVDAKAASIERTPEPLDLDRIYSELSVAPVESNGANGTYTASGSYGYGFDLQNAKALLRTALPGEEIRIPLAYIEPTSKPVIGEFRDTLASCQSPHSNNENRNTNLLRACESINGKVLQPGEVLSFNAALGERTMVRGYRSAPEYSMDSLAQPVGGGINHVASVLYYCAVLADLSIPERHNAEFMSSFVDIGMDAYVGWPGSDLMIRNNTSHAIRFIAECNPDYVRIEIQGTDEKDYYIKTEYQMSTLKSEYVYQDVPDGAGYHDGDILLAGYDGAFIQSYRCKYSKQTNALISREPEAGSNYPSQPTVIARVIRTIPETTTPELPTLPPTEQPVPTPTTEPPTAPSTEQTVPSPTLLPEPIPEPIPAPIPDGFIG